MLTTASSIDTGAVGKDYMERSMTRLIHKAYELANKPPNNHEFAPRVFDPLAMAYLVTQDTLYSNAVETYLKAFLRRDHGVGSELYVSARLQSFGLCYDWLYDVLSPTIKQEIVDTLKNRLNETNSVKGRRMTRHICGGDAGFSDTINFACADTSVHPIFTIGHPLENNVNLMGALIPLVEDYPELNSALEKVYDNFLNGFDKVREWAAVDGALYTSAKYSRFQYLSVLPAMFTMSAMEDSALNFPYLSQIYSRFLYGLNEDYAMPNSSDNVYWSLKDGSPNDPLIRISLFAARFNNDPYAHWFYQQNIEPYLKDGNDIFALILGDPSMASKAPTDLPMGKHFRNGAYVYMRDSWEYEKATSVEFIATPFLNDGHQHQDRGSFVLNYKGNLFHETGEYEDYSSHHFWNYFTRSIAHNTITVYDSSEKYYLAGYPSLGEISNDGGQTIPKQWPTFEENPSYDIQPGGGYYVGGINTFECRDGYDYTYGDFTKSYSSAKLNEFSRQFLFIRDKNITDLPWILILDKVATTFDGFEKRFHLHSSQLPDTTNQRVSVDNGGGMAIAQTLLPAQVDKWLIGGMGNEFTVNSTNYPQGPADQPLHPHDDGVWRIDVVPAQKDTLDYFMHLISVHESGETPEVPKAVVTQNDSVIAISVNKKLLVTFPAHPDTLGLDSFTVSIDTVEMDKMMVYGLQPEQPYTLSANDSLLMVSPTQSLNDAHFSLSGTSSSAGSFELNPLDILLGNFIYEWNAKRNGNQIDLHWKYANSEGLKQFTIERSFDGQNFIPIADALPHASQAYQWTDHKAYQKVSAGGKVYYRLKILGDQTIYSAIRSIGFESQPLTMYPNPSNGDFYIRNPYQTPITVDVYDLQGRLTITASIPSGVHQFSMGNKKAGIFLLRYQIDSYPFVEKILVK